VIGYGCGQRHLPLFQARTHTVEASQEHPKQAKDQHEAVEC